MSKKCIDHLGNKFNTIVGMCKFWGIPYSTYSSRIHMGWSKEDALTKLHISPAIQCTDHLNNTYKSKRYMCKVYKISESTLDRRLNSGMSLEEALTKKAILGHTCIKDHTGTQFNSFESMCKHWNKNPSTVKKRLLYKMSLKDALELPVRLQNNVCNIHMFGTIYKNITEISEKLNISYQIVRYRIINLNKFGKYDSEILFSIEHIREIKLQFISITNVAWYKVLWSEEFKNTRQVIEHYRPDLLSLYDISNPNGTWNHLEKDR